MQDLSKSITPTIEETKMMREQFINKYSKDKGWDPDKLSSNQMLEIVTQRGYKNPALILG